MILKSTVFEKQKEYFSDIRNAEKNHYDPGYNISYFNYPIPQLPESFNKDIKYKDFTLNLYKMSCTCEDYFRHTAMFSENDIRCICKHLYFKLMEKAQKHLWNLTILILENQYKFGIQFLYKFDGKNSINYFGFQKCSEWVTVYALNKKEWQRYSYNFNTNRWSYNKLPEYNQDIENKIKKLVRKDV